MRPNIVIGDKTNHGGTVISADFTSTINNKGMARVGDLVVCPKCKGVFPIVEGDPGTMDGTGRSYARAYDKTACGAQLLPSQYQTGYVSHGGAGGGAAAENDAQASAASASPLVAAETLTLCLDCLVKAAAKGSGMVVR